MGIKNWFKKPFQEYRDGVQQLRDYSKNQRPAEAPAEFVGHILKSDRTLQRITDAVNRTGLSEEEIVQLIYQYPGTWEKEVKILHLARRASRRL